MSFVDDADIDVIVSVQQFDEVQAVTNHNVDVQYSISLIMNSSKAN